MLSPRETVLHVIVWSVLYWKLKTDEKRQRNLMFMEEMLMNLNDLEAYSYLEMETESR